MAASSVAAPAPGPPAAPAATQWGDSRADTLIAAGLNAVRSGAIGRATALSTKLKALYPDEPARLVIDFALATGQMDGRTAAMLFTRMAGETPHRLAPPLPLLDPDQVSMLMSISRGGDAVRVARTVLDTGWSGGPGDFEPINARRTLVDAALAAGDVSTARTLAMQNDNTFSVRDFAIQEKYRPIHAALAARWGTDLAGVGDRERLKWHDLATAPDPSIVALSEHGRWQIVDGHPESAVAAMLPALDRAFLPATAPRHRFPFVDVLAHALARVGRGDEAIALYGRFRRSVRDTDESYRDATFAEMLLLGNLGRARDALARATDAEAHVAKAIPALLPWAYRTRVCAAADIGDRVTADRALRTLLAGNGPEQFKVQALLCLDRIDDAAAAAVVALRRRAGLATLRRLQIEPATRWGRWQQRWDAGFAALRDRADVKAAVAGYGVIRVIAFPDIDNV